MKISHDDLPTTGLARANDPGTSKAAAAKVERTTLAARVLTALRDYGPMTTVEIAEQLEVPRDSVSPRMTKLVEGKWVEDTKRVRNGRTVWAAVGYSSASLFPTPAAPDPDKPLELALCEASTLMLHPYRLYRFIPDASCLNCMRLLEQHDRITGERNLPR